MTRNVLLVLALVLIPAVASADAKFEEITTCLGSTEVIQAPAGYVYTYTQAKYGMGWPNMASEGLVAEAAGTSNDGEIAPVTYEILPNALAFQADETDADYPKGSPAYNPVAYMDLAASDTSRVVIRSRAAGQRLVVLWGSNPSNGKQVSHYIKVNARQCGMTTTLPVANMANICEGSAVLSASGTHLVSDDESVLVFRGSSSNLTAVGGVWEGRARVSAKGRRSSGATFVATVKSEDEWQCPSAAPANLEPIEGENNYSLELCRGELWMVPSGPVADVSADGFGVWAEASVEKRAFAVIGQIEGEANVTIEFTADVPDMHIQVNVITCE